MVNAVAAAVLLLAQAPAASPAAPPDTAALLGTWRGTSVCTDREAAPACNDETIVYEFKAGAQPGTVRWAADKVVDGKRLPMGEMDLTWDAAEQLWKAEFTSPRARTEWRVMVRGTRLVGTGRLLPGNQVIRRMAARKD